LSEGKPFAWGQNEEQISAVTTKALADLAKGGDRNALAVFEESGRRLGQGLAILMDILNPERIVIGSVFARAEELLRPAMEAVLAEEALESSRLACRILPSALGEDIGNVASLAVIDN